MKKIFNYFSNRLLIDLIVISLVVIAFISDDLSTIWIGLNNIIKNQSALLVDYIAIGGIGAAFINVAIIISIDLIIIKLLKIDFSGQIVTALMIVMGYSFLGINFLTIIPIYLGVYLYSLLSKRNIKNLIIVLIYSAGISPAVSVTAVSLGLSTVFGIILSIVVGIIIGFSLQPVSNAASRMHRGYNLGNVGFVAGVIGFVYYAVIQAFGIQLILGVEVTYEYTNLLLIYGLIISFTYIIIGFIGNSLSFKGYRELLRDTGKYPNDNLFIHGKNVTLINMGILGIAAIFYIFAMQTDLNGPIFGGIISVIGIGAFGGHIRNYAPLALGVVIMAYISNYDTTFPPAVISGFFVLGLVPLPGRYGFITGIFAGMLHLSIATVGAQVHGGMDLYNSSFSTGFIAFIMVAIFDGLNFHPKFSKKSKTYDEKMKVSKIVSELVAYFSLNDCDQIETSLDLIDYNKSIIIIKVKNIEQELVNAIIDEIGSARRLEIEEYAWEMVGSGSIGRRLNLVGRLIDQVEVSYEQEYIIFKMLRIN